MSCVREGGGGVGMQLLKLLALIPIVFCTKGGKLWHLVSPNDSSSILYPIVHRLTLIFNIFQKEK